MLNREWHQTHPMPSKATLDQRIAWHIEHAQACGCRSMPASITAEIARRGMDGPERVKPPSSTDRPARP